MTETGAHVCTCMCKAAISNYALDLCQSSRLQNTIIGMCLHVCVGGKVVHATCSMKLRKFYSNQHMGTGLFARESMYVGVREMSPRFHSEYSWTELYPCYIHFMIRSLTCGEAELRWVMALMSSVTSESIYLPRFQGFTIQTLVTPLQERTIEQWKYNYAFVLYVSALNQLYNCTQGVWVSAFKMN